MSQRLGRADSQGLSIAFETFPAAAPVGTAVLSHGGGQSRLSWESTARSLQQAGWSAVTVDARGHGDSDWAAPQAYSHDERMADLKSVSDLLDDEPVLIGASMGGTTSVLAVAEGVVAARGLVIIDMAPRVDARGVSRVTSFMRSAPNGYASLEELADAIASYKNDGRRPTNVSKLEKHVRQRADGRWHWHWDPAILDYDSDEQRAKNEERVLAALPRVTVPVLLVRGEHSDVVSREAAQQVLDLLPHAQYLELAGASHMVTGSDNHEFTDSVLGFLSGL